jgi:hypothetical protein
MSAEGQPVACGQVLKRPLAVSITWRPGRGWMEPAAGGAALVGEHLERVAPHSPVGADLG